VGEVSNGTILVFPTSSAHIMVEKRDIPDGSGDSGNSVFLGNLGLIDGDLGEFTRLLVKLDRLGTDCQFTR